MIRGLRNNTKQVGRGAAAVLGGTFLLAFFISGAQAATVDGKELPLHHVSAEDCKDCHKQAVADGKTNAPDKKCTGCHKK